MTARVVVSVVCGLLAGMPSYWFGAPGWAVYGFTVTCSMLVYYTWRLP